MPYGAFIVPGLIMLSLFTESISNASFGIYLPEVHRHDLRAAVRAGVVRWRSCSPTSARRRPSRSCSGSIILATAVVLRAGAASCIPVWMVAFLVLTATTFSLFGFIIGIWAKGFEQLQFIPMLVVTPLTFLGGAFYSIDMLPPAWRTFSLFNPVVYLISGFRWSFYGTSDVGSRREPRDDARLLRHLPRHRRLDLQDRLPAQELTGTSPPPLR